MLKTTYYKNNTNNNYTLAHSKQQYINSYGLQQYNYVQQLFNTQCTLQTIIHCVANDEVDCYTTNLLVAQYNNTYYMLYLQNNATHIVQLNCKTLQHANNYIFTVMQLLQQLQLL